MRCQCCSNVGVPSRIADISSGEGSELLTENHETDNLLLNPIIPSPYSYQRQLGPVSFNREV
jgi:hypothetical protein